MDFSEREIADLAAFFAKRFPSYEQRAALCEAAGLAGDAQLTGDALTVWTDVVRVAVERKRLNDLVERAMQQRPDDENLREMAAVVSSGRRWRSRRWGLLIGVPLVGAGLLLVWSPWSGDAPTPSEPAGDGIAMADAEAPAPEPAPPADVAEPSPEANVGEGLPTRYGSRADESPAPEPEPAPEPAPPADEPEPTPVAKPTPKPAGAPLRCEGPDGEIVGYWYAGEDAPAKGSTHTVDGGMNVRVDYPDVHNDFDARSALVCTLGHGWQLRIGHEPLAVPGGAYWVPLSPDDIVAR